MKIAIASGKGGTGKTTVSTNLAYYISQEREILLADLDVEEPNSGLFIHGEVVHKEDKFKYIPKWEKENCDFCGYCQEVCNFNAIIPLGKQVMVFPELCHGCFACSELCPKQALPMIPRKIGDLSYYKQKNLHFVDSKLLIGEEQAVPLIGQTIRYTDEQFPNINLKIFDAPPGTSCPVIEVAKNSDLIILVTEPTPFGLHDLKLAIETMEKMDKDFFVVINRSDLGDNEVRRFCEKKNIPIIAEIRNDRKIAQEYSAGKLIFDLDDDIQNQFKKIYDYISAKESEFLNKTGSSIGVDKGVK